LVVNVNSIIIEVCTVAESCSGAAITASARMPKSDPKHFKMKKDGISTPKFKAIQFLRYHTPYMPTRRRLVGGLVTVSKTDYTGILMVESVVPISTGGREIRKETQGAGVEERWHLATMARYMQWLHLLLSLLFRPVRLALLR
jgi:hypothetical protein